MVTSPLMKWSNPPMSETIQMRTTQEESGDYRVFATATVGGEQPVKGLALHTDIVSRLPSAEYVEVELTSEGAVSLSPDKATSATVRFATSDGPAVRHVYVSPSFLEGFGSFSFDGTDTDLRSVPSLAIDGISASSEEDYESDKEERGSAEEAADALFGDSDETEESEAETEESEDVEISDEEIGIVE